MVYSGKLFFYWKSTSSVRNIQMNVNVYFCCFCRCCCNEYMNGIDDSFKSQAKIYFAGEERKNQITLPIVLPWPLTRSCSPPLLFSLRLFLYTKKLIPLKSSSNMLHEVTNLRKESNSWHGAKVSRIWWMTAMLIALVKSNIHTNYTSTEKIVYANELKQYTF